MMTLDGLQTKIYFKIPKCYNNGVSIKGIESIYCIIAFKKKRTLHYKAFIVFRKEIYCNIQL